MIHINTGPAGSDCTAPYYISFDKPKTVGEFIEEWLTTRPKEWGHFSIYKEGSFRGEPSCDYKYGEIVGDPLPDEYLNAEIEKVTGSGGWTLSEFTFYLVDRTYMGESKLIQLKPCPFCGGVAKIHKLEKHSIYTFWVECEECKVNTPTYFSKESATTKWNTRKEGKK